MCKEKFKQKFKIFRKLEKIIKIKIKIKIKKDKWKMIIMTRKKKEKRMKMKNWKIINRKKIMEKRKRIKSNLI